MRALIEDLRYGFRLLQSNLGFTAVAVLTLALGIASSTTVFSWMDNLLLHPLPGTVDSRRIVVLEGITSGGNIQTSYLDYLDYRDQLKQVSGLIALHSDVMSLGEDEEATPVWGELVSNNYFDVLGVQPIAGRTLGLAESNNAPGANPVVVISERLWRSRFHSDPRMLGKPIRVNRHDLTLIGIVPSSFRGTVNGLTYDLWTPISMGV